MKIAIGTSGWSYEHWDKVFYPKIPSSQRLSHYCKRFNSLEINTTFYQLLKKHNIALCISDLAGRLSPLILTADFIYIRLHGPKKKYSGTYGKKGLSSWVKRVKEWKQKKTIYVYFDNDEKGYAAQDAELFAEMIRTHPL